MYYDKPNKILYRITQLVANAAAKLVYQRKYLRNEIKGVKGPFVVIANHQSMLDFVNLIGATRRPMHFVISNSFFNSLPIRGFMKRLGVIPKQQFQTATRDLKRMKAVIDRGEPVVIYPAGLMCEDGLSTPIPAATYKFLKWLKTDVYVAKTSGNYFVMPKWSKNIRRGRTYMDIYKLFSSEELAQTDLKAIQQKTDAAMLFDAYREQEQLQIAYKGGEDLQGLEHVLYMCPHCKGEFTVAVERNRIYCTACGFAHESDRYGLLRQTGTVGREMRYISDWSRMIYADMKQKQETGELSELSSTVSISMIDMKKKKFLPVGQGVLSLSEERFCLTGTVNGEELDISVAAGTFPSLPFSPGKYLEFQYGEQIYRCAPEDGRVVMKYINLVKVLYERSWRKEVATEKV